MKRKRKKKDKTKLQELVIEELDAEELDAEEDGADADKTDRGKSGAKDVVQAENRKPEGKGRVALLAGLVTVLAAAVLAGFYVGLSEYYKSGFSYGTWINGIYCTGKTVEEVNRELLQSCYYEGLMVYDGQGNAYRLEAEDIGYTFDFKEALLAYLEEQNPYLWAGNLFHAREKKLTPVVTFGEAELLAALEAIPDYADGGTEQDRDVEIRKTDAGYVLEDERRNVLNKEKVQEAVRSALLSFETEINLTESGCYEDLPYSPGMLDTLARWEQIREFQDCRIVYRFGEEEVPVDASVACDWIAVDGEGNFLTDEQGRLLADGEKMDGFVEHLADEYDTLGGSRSFQTTRGETITVEGGIYGNKIDREAEKAYLKQAFYDRVEEIHEPAYLQKGWAEGRNDIGDTYIEVDMTEQMMYYYVDGKMEIETPIVTGNTGRRMGTPEGVNYVYGKAQNRVLTGPGYASHVNFWMPVKGNIGIHDAAWRSEYGGKIYKTGGSHGCINTPYDAMSRLYDMAEVGTPVVMFY